MDTRMTPQSHIFILKEKEALQNSQQRSVGQQLICSEITAITLECYSLYTSAAAGTYKVPVIHLSAHKCIGPLCSTEYSSAATPARFQPQCLIGLGFDRGLWRDPILSYSFILLPGKTTWAVSIDWCCHFHGVFPSLWDRRDTITLQYDNGFWNW